MNDIRGEVQSAREAIQEVTGVEHHDVAVILGSGLGAYPARFPGAAAVAYDQIPGFPLPEAVGHTGIAYSVAVASRQVLLLAGRGHAYEGHELTRVVLPVRAAIAAGCQTVVLTNAAGGIASGLSPGDLTVIGDHLNLTGRNPLVGSNDDRIGPRFPDLTDVYTPRLRQVACHVAADEGMTLEEVVYAWWLGPSFETPAEIRMIQTLGGDVVGMSTVPEAIAARHMGARVVGFSLVTNRAAGLSGERITSEEVMEVAAAVRPRIESFLDRFLAHPELTD